MFISSARRGHVLFLGHDPVLFLDPGQQLQEREEKQLYIFIDNQSMPEFQSQYV